MDISNAKSVMDSKMMTAILAADPDGLAVIGLWNGMRTMAGEDPEGCVRLDPGVPMGIPALAGFFHCAVNIVEKAVALFGNMNWLTVKDGMIRICACAMGKNADAVREHRNLLNRLRVQRCRAKKKLQKMMAAGEKTDSAAGLPEEDDNGNGAVTDVTHPVMDVMVSEEKRKKQRKENIYNKINTLKNPDKHIRIYGSQEKEKETVIPLPAGKTGEGSCLPFVPEENSRMVSLDNLPAPCRNVLETWNKLPLKKFTGLIPSFLQKLNGLLARYGEADVRKAVESIGRSPFLLGKKSDWIVTLGWLLEPDNFAKVLSGKYQDRNDGNNCYTDWRPGERFPFYLPGEDEEPADEEPAKQGTYEQFRSADPTHEKVARLLGLAG